jgi:hypothetical protein
MWPYTDEEWDFISVGSKKPWLLAIPVMQHNFWIKIKAAV